jgi:hypothetical protein
MDLAAAAGCQADRSADNPCLNLSNSRRLELLPSLQHRLHIAHLLNNQNTRVWAVVVVALAQICEDQWICAHNPGEVVVGYKPIS